MTSSLYRLARVALIQARQCIKAHERGGARDPWWLLLAIDYFHDAERLRRWARFDRAVDRERHLLMCACGVPWLLCPHSNPSGR